MQNKKSLLQRLLVIYITFFIVLVASIAHGILPNFSRGAAEGAELGNDIAEKWKSGVPRMIYMLGDIRVTGQPETAVEIAAAPGVEIKANVRKLALVVEQNAPGTSPLGLAFRSIGGSAWLYALVMLCPLLYLAIIVLMFVIIHSLRRSIREERRSRLRPYGRPSRPLRPDGARGCRDRGRRRHRHQDGGRPQFRTLCRGSGLRFAEPL